MTLIYSMLSTSLASSILEPAGRCAALNTLHQAVTTSTQSLSNFAPIEHQATMHTPQQLQFRAMSTIGALWHSVPDDAPLEMRRILAINFAHLILTSPGVETLTLEHLPYARNLLDMVFYLKSEDDEVGRNLLALIGNYLCQLDGWSEDAGHMTRELIELYVNPDSSFHQVYRAAFLAFNLSHCRGIFLSSEMSVICHTVVNLLLPGPQGEQSAWRALCDTSPRGIQADYITSLAEVLASKLIFLMRRGFEVTHLIEEFLGGERLCNLIYAVCFYRSMAHMAQHVRELSRDWWECTKARLLSLAKDENEFVGTVPSHPSLLSHHKPISGPATVSSFIADMIREVDTLNECQTCLGPFKLERIAQDVVDHQDNPDSSLLPVSYLYRRTRAAASRMARRRRSFAATARNNELSTTTP